VEADLSKREPGSGEKTAAISEEIQSERGNARSGPELSVATCLAAVREGLSAGAMEVRQYSPLTLAYLGDAVYELLIRTLVVTEGNAPVNKLNRRASSFSQAAAQSNMANHLQEYFTAEELSVYKRGRNAHSYTKAKNATVGDYRRATGLEAVIGFLYLQGEMARIVELMSRGLEHV